ncbi:MAG TPA: DUF3040 domain-containing protein [Streptosporangiaceae bacterium]|nr:DUF3040 domain-containing protein [Streptosporangiaceae bacterium]
MSLSAREQHALDTIETALTGSDPDLAVLLATFGRLTSGEEMPAGEKILGSRWWYRPRGRRRGRGLIRGSARGLGRACSRTWGLVRRVWRRLGWPRTGLLLWIVVSVGLITLAPVINRGSQRACPAHWAAACARLVPGRAGSLNAPTAGSPSLGPRPH